MMREHEYYHKSFPTNPLKVRKILLENRERIPGTAHGLLIIGILGIILITQQLMLQYLFKNLFPSAYLTAFLIAMTLSFLLAFLLFYLQGQFYMRKFRMDIPTPSRRSNN